jgi:hypothetical protein
MSNATSRIVLVVLAIAALAGAAWAQTDETTPPTGAGAPAAYPDSLAATGQPATEPATGPATGPATEPATEPTTGPAVPPATGPITPPGSPPGTTVQAVREGEEQGVASYALQLRDLEQRINQLKQEVFRSKARLAQLAETVIQGTASGRSKIKIVHKNEMSGTFQLVKLSYFLDRSPVYQQVDDSGELGDLDEINVYESIIAPGDHTISVEIEYRGYGHGIFSYLQGYRFRVNSSHTITIAGGKEVTIQGIGFEQGDPLTAIEERPTIRFTEQIRDLSTPASGGQ